MSKLVVEKTKEDKFETFQGSSLFRHRIVFATLTHTPIEINNIRSKDEDNGLRDYELNFLELLDSITNGSLIEINETGTRVRYRPGTIIGSNSALTHKCTTTRGISYWIEPLIMLLIFGKYETTITLTGATYHDLDISIDVIRGVLLPMLNKLFRINDLKMDLKRRAFPPSGGGEVLLTIPVISKLTAIDWTQVGMIKRIRGLCYTIAMAPTLANRVRSASNELLYNFISDVWIFNDKTTRSELQNALMKEMNIGQNSNNSNEKDNIKVSSGYGLSLIAETTNNVMISIHQQIKDGLTAEEFGNLCGKLLLQEISYGGTVDTSIQSIILIFMALCPEDVSRVRLGRMSQHSVKILRLIREMLGVTFKLNEDDQTGTIFASCMGMGYQNVWRLSS